MPIIEDAVRPVLILSYLEKESQNIQSLRAKMDFYDDDVSGRRTQRCIKNLIETEVIVEKPDKKYSILDSPEKWTLIGSLMIDYFNTEYFRTRTWGEMNSRIIAENLENIKRPVNFMMKLKGALENSQRISFHYTPQNFEVSDRIKKAGFLFPPGTPSGKIPVCTLPRFLAFSRRRMMLIGETGFAGEVRLCRYELRGMGPFETLEVTNPSIKISQEDCYDNSLKVWQSGEPYNLTVAEFNPDEIAVTDPVKMHSVSVNGDLEILSCILESNGKLKIVDPPEGILKKARQFNFGEHIFYFNKSV